MGAFIKVANVAGESVVLRVDDVLSVEPPEDDNLNCPMSVITAAYMEKGYRIITRYELAETVDEVWDKLRKPLIVG